MPAREDLERAALIALLRSRPPGWGWTQLAADIGERGSAVTLWHEWHPADLFESGGDERDLPAELVDAITRIDKWGAAEIQVLSFLDERYPARLRDIHEMPPVLFARGELVSDEVAVSVVGSRSASARGREIAHNVATGLVERGIAVISGLARGIDTAAHTAALAAGGRTVAVLGCGLEHHYPPENRALQERIAVEGLVMSQFWPEATPRRQQFPMRNAVMSGYGRATVVVEAGEQSGARIQARQAVQHGRPVIVTDLVATSTDWARRLIGSPGVHVAASTAEVMEHVERLVASDAEIAELLAAGRT